VIRAISGKEKKVKEMIDWKCRRSNMGTHISQVLIPMEKFYQIRDGKKVSKERNFFPGYVLMEADLTGEIAHTIKNMPNVIGFLGAEKGWRPRSLAPERGEPHPGYRG
jgi:transcriptional antiterminator NusG